MGNQTFLINEDADMNVCEHVTMEGNQVTNEFTSVLRLVLPVPPKCDPYNSADDIVPELDLCA